MYPKWAYLHFHEILLSPRYPRTVPTLGLCCPRNEELSYINFKKLNIRGPGNKWWDFKKTFPQRILMMWEMPTMKHLLKNAKKYSQMLTVTFHLWMIKLWIVLFLHVFLFSHVLNNDYLLLYNQKKKYKKSLRRIYKILDQSWYDQVDHYYKNQGPRFLSILLNACHHCFILSTRMPHHTGTP